MATATFTIPDFHRIDSAHAGRTKKARGFYAPRACTIQIVSVNDEPNDNTDENAADDLRRLVAHMLVEHRPINQPPR